MLQSSHKILRQETHQQGSDDGVMEITLTDRKNLLTTSRTFTLMCFSSGAANQHQDRALGYF